MKTKHTVALLLATLIYQISATAQGTAFTYQGRLNEGANPANGSFDLRFAIYDAASNGSMAGSSTITNAATPVTNGLFTVTLDFGAGVFDGNARWLEIGVQPAGGTNFATLAPRQALTATPYAQFAGSAATAAVAASANAVAAANISGTVTLAQLPPAVLTNGAAFAGDGTGVTNVNAATLNGQSAANFWQLGGNAATPGQFLGSTNNQPVEIWVNSQRSLRIEPNSATAPNIIAGAPVNYVANGVAGATISGGGALNYTGGKTNSVTADFGTVSGGSQNSVNGMLGTVSGGFNNKADGPMAVISGGFNNKSDGFGGVVGGGNGNTNATGADYGTVSGGNNNTAAGSYSSVGGGWHNTASGLYATISGGNNNNATNQMATVAGGGNNTATTFGATVSGGLVNTASGLYATVGGGNNNTASAQNATVVGGFFSQATTNYATVAGGSYNLAGGQNSFAAGRMARAQHDGSFVWADSSQFQNFNSATTNEFAVRAIGGVRLVTSGAGATVDGQQVLTSQLLPYFWQLGGNNVAAGQFFGSTNNQPLELFANGIRALRLEPNADGLANVVGGSPSNTIAAGVSGAVIAGGDQNFILASSGKSAIGGGSYNTIQTNSGFSTIAGGFDNRILNSAANSTIGGGAVNQIRDTNFAATISGGYGNIIQANAANSAIGGGNINVIEQLSERSTIAGGYHNNIKSNATYATIGGGGQNVIQTAADDSSIGGGYGNVVKQSSANSSIGGGYQNTIQANASSSVIGGGGNNEVQANAGGATISGGGGNTVQTGASGATIGGGEGNTVTGSYGTVPGGSGNIAAAGSFAAGNRAKAVHSGSFVWADTTPADFSTATNNQFLIRANGGVIINYNPGYEQIAPNGESLVVGGDTFIDGKLEAITASVSNVNASIGDFDQINVVNSVRAQGYWADFGKPQNAVFTSYNLQFKDSGSVGAHCDGLTWMDASDKNLKQGFEPLNNQTILNKVATLPITKWSYKTQGEKTRHIGPVAQDFYAAFGVGADDKHIATLDESGVALAAIQGLNEKVEARNQKSEVRIQKMETENAELKQRLEKLEQLLTRQLSEVKK